MQNAGPRRTRPMVGGSACKGGEQPLPSRLFNRNLDHDAMSTLLPLGV
jgi:hypothetical protein